MSNGKDKPGEYLVLPNPNTPVLIKSVAEAQEASGYLLSAMTDTYLVFYKKDKH